MAYRRSWRRPIGRALKADGIGIEEEWLRRIGPAHFSHINFRGTFRFNLEKYSAALVGHTADIVPGKLGR